jgi:hypothetical protein
MKKGDLLQKAISLIETLQTRFSNNENLSPESRQSALQMLSVLLEKLRQGKSSAFVPTAFYNVGILLLNNKMYKESISALKNAAAVFQAQGPVDKVREAQLLHGKALFALSKEVARIDIATSIIYIEEAVSLLKSISVPENDNKFDVSLSFELALMHTRLVVLKRESFERKGLSTIDASIQLAMAAMDLWIKVCKLRDFGPSIKLFSIFQQLQTLAQFFRISRHIPQHVLALRMMMTITDNSASKTKAFLLASISDALCTIGYTGRAVQYLDQLTKLQVSPILESSTPDFENLETEILHVRAKTYMVMTPAEITEARQRLNNILSFTEGKTVDHVVTAAGAHLTLSMLALKDGESTSSYYHSKESLNMWLKLFNSAASKLVGEQPNNPSKGAARDLCDEKNIDKNEKVPMHTGLDSQSQDTIRAVKSLSCLHDLPSWRVQTRWSWLDGLLSSLAQVAHVCLLQGLPAEAEFYLRLGTQLAAETYNPVLVANFSLQLAELERGRVHFDQSRLHLEKCDGLLADEDARAGVCKHSLALISIATLTGKGDVCVRIQDSSAAAMCFARAEAILRTLSDTSYVMQLFHCGQIEDWLHCGIEFASETVRNDTSDWCIRESAPLGRRLASLRRRALELDLGSLLSEEACQLAASAVPRFQKLISGLHAAASLAAQCGDITEDARAKLALGRLHAWVVRGFETRSGGTDDHQEPEPKSRPGRKSNAKTKAKAKARAVKSAPGDADGSGPAQLAACTLRPWGACIENTNASSSKNPQALQIQHVGDTLLTLQQALAVSMNFVGLSVSLAW